jgi:RNA polymerase sigma-70 factor (ECF subfamily)
LGPRDIPYTKADSDRRLSICVTRQLAMMNTDEQLVLAFQGGSQEAFAELFERYREPVYRFFRRRMDHAARAEELAQECFLALLRNVRRYEPRASFRSYLYGIAMNLVFAERRKAGREVSENEKLDERPDESKRGITTEAGIWVRDALEHLQKDEREILMLREYEQLSYEEIGALMRLPVNTVRSRLFRARMALKEQLIPVKDGD